MNGRSKSVKLIMIPLGYQLESAITRPHEVEIGRPGGRWKAESQGFPTATIRASEDLAISSYERFEIVPPPADFFKIDEIVPPPADADARADARMDGRTDGRMDGHR